MANVDYAALGARRKCRRARRIMVLRKFKGEFLIPIKWPEKQRDSVFPSKIIEADMPSRLN
jgi:hypothetical protein